MNPDFRYLIAVKIVGGDQKAVAPDGLTRELVDFLGGKPNVRSEIADAFRLYSVEDHRAAMDAFCLARSTPAVISTVLEVPVSVIEVYQVLFMDLRAFRNKLERMSFASNYPGAEHREVMKQALVSGENYLRWLYNSPNPEVTPRSIVKSTMVDQYYRGMAHKGNGLATNVSREALKWISQGIKHAQVMEELEPQSASVAAEQLKIALTIDDSTKTVPEAPVPVNQILH